MDEAVARLRADAEAESLGGRHAAAAEAFRRLLKAAPEDADAWADLAGHLLHLGSATEAAAACARALNLAPGHAGARINLGCARLTEERPQEAVAIFRSALHEHPHRLDARLFLAEGLLTLRHADAAQAALMEVGVPRGAWRPLAPRLADLWALLGRVRLDVRDHAAAVLASRRALDLDSTHLGAQTTLAATLLDQGRLEDAHLALDALEAAHPQDSNVQLLRMTTLARGGRAEAADGVIADILRRHPLDLTVHRSVFGTHYAQGRWPEAQAELDRFRRLRPGEPYATFEQSFLDLLFGHMEQGWRHYEARLRVTPPLRPQRTFQAPTWDGAPLENRTLLLWAEQGLGDTLMFLRYLPRVKALGGRVVLEVQGPLRALATTLKAADQVLVAGEAHPHFDLQASLLSLPAIFRTDLATLPAEVPYLDVPAHVPRRRALAQALAQAGDRPRVGLVWAGNPAHKRDVERSLRPGALSVLSALAGVAWFSLQVGATEVPDLPGLRDLAPLLTTFDDTAYALGGLDLLISVDTSVAHLAGALGVPTFLLLSQQPDYRWMLGREDSPWYPSLRLYRQPRYGDWDAALHQVVSDLSEGAAASSGA